MHAGKFLDRYTPPHIITLILITGLSALSINVFLPSLPSISSHFGEDKAVVQLSITLYLVSVGFLSPVLGPLTDYYGRRPIVLLGLSGFFAGTLICIYAVNIEIFLLGRIFQSLSAAGMVASRAIVRDMVSRDKAASMIGYITMGMALAPMIGPAIGGFLDEHYGWQSSFWMLFVFGLFVSFFAWSDLGETRGSAASSLTGQFTSYPKLLKSRRFWGYSLAAAFCAGAFFSLLGGSPYIATDYLHLTPTQFGLFFAFVSVGYMSGNFISGRWSEKLGVARMMIGGNLIMFCGILVAAVLLSSGDRNPYYFFGPLLFLGLGNGMTLPNANAGIVSIHPEIAGAASGLGGFIQVIGGASFSVLAGIVIGPHSEPMPLLMLMMASALLAFGATLYVMYVDRLEVEKVTGNSNA